jgi:GTP diphosphokinase / guanosine-3',5'-bis(diphosphate) 3'-diphosphatase
MSAMIVRAAELARHLHHGQSQADGSSYFEGHLTAVADVLFDAGASREMIAAGYLHSAVTNGALSVEEIEREFGVEVAAVVGGLTDRWHGHAGTLSHAQNSALELERLLAESGLVQTIKLADDLVRLRQVHLVEPEVRETLLADVGARVEHLVLAESQVRYQVHAELAHWTDSGRTLRRALAIMELPVDSRSH